MRVIIVGAGGVLGQTVVAALESRHDIVKVGRKSGDFRADITDEASLEALFDQVGAFDALACAAGEVAFAPLAKMTSAQWEIGLRSKLMGQVK